MTARRAWAGIAVLTAGTLLAACTADDHNGSAARTLRRAVARTLRQPSFRVEQRSGRPAHRMDRQYEAPDRERTTFPSPAPAWGCKGMELITVGAALYASTGTTPEIYRALRNPTGKRYGTAADELEWIAHNARGVHEVEPDVVELTPARDVQRRLGHVIATVELRHGLVHEVAFRPRGSSQPSVALTYRDFGQVPPIEAPAPEQLAHETGPTPLCTNPDLAGPSVQVLPDGSTIVEGTGATPP